MKLKLYNNGIEEAISEHYVREDIQESESGKFICFTTLEGKKIITNMDFVVDEENA